MTIIHQFGLCWHQIFSCSIHLGVLFVVYYIITVCVWSRHVSQLMCGVQCTTLRTQFSASILETVSLLVLLLCVLQTIWSMSFWEILLSLPLLAGILGLQMWAPYLGPGTLTQVTKLAQQPL